MAESGEFSGSIAAFYERNLVPLIFEPYADDIARRLADKKEAWLLETAAGTDAVTRRLAATLPASVPIVATDISQPMLDLGERIGTTRRVDWKQADASALPFHDDSFDILVCQFGFMFFPDKAKAFAEAKRVLRPGGTLLFNVWDRIGENEFVDTVVTAVAQLFPDSPPTFMATVPHGYSDPAVIGADMTAGGFGGTHHLQTVGARSRGTSARAVAVAYCQGTPLRTEIVQRDASRLDEATDAAERALAARFGDGPIEGRIRAHVITAH